MPDKTQQKHRTNRVFKSLHKPLTYLGVERTLFYFVCVDEVIKPWKESASLNDHINLYGFWNETAFLTKSGDVGIVLGIPGVDYESLDRLDQEYAIKRL